MLYMLIIGLLKIRSLTSKRDSSYKYSDKWIKIARHLEICSD